MEALLITVILRGGGGEESGAHIHHTERERDQGPTFTTHRKRERERDQVPIFTTERERERERERELELENFNLQGLQFRFS